MTKDDRKLIKAIDSFVRAANELTELTAHPTTETWSVMAARFEAPIFTTQVAKAEMLLDGKCLERLANILGETIRERTDIYGDSKKFFTHKGITLFTYD